MVNRIYNRPLLGNTNKNRTAIKPTNHQRGKNENSTVKVVKNYLANIKQNYTTVCMVKRVRLCE